MGQVVVHPAATVRRPEQLSAAHDVSAFESSQPSLDSWLKERAVRNEGRYSRTYVVCAPDTNIVIGFYALAVGGVQHAEAPKKLRRNAPDPIPVMVLGRLAVVKSWERRGLGASLLRDAILRTAQASEVAGIAAILVHALSEEAAGFYWRHCFEPSELHPLTLMLSLAAIENALS